MKKLILLSLLAIWAGQLSAAAAPKGPEHEVAEGETAVVATSGEYSVTVKKDSNKMAVIQLISSLRGELGKINLHRSGEVLGLKIHVIGNGNILVKGWMGDDAFNQFFLEKTGNADRGPSWVGPEHHLWRNHPNPPKS